MRQSPSGVCALRSGELRLKPENGELVSATVAVQNEIENRKKK